MSLRSKMKRRYSFYWKRDTNQPIYKLRRNIKTVTREQQEDQKCLTVLNTGDQHEKLIKVTTAGEWFCVTDGGVALNCDDAILGLEIKGCEERKEKLCNKKEEIHAAKKANKRCRTNCFKKRKRFKQMAKRKPQEND